MKQLAFVQFFSWFALFSMWIYTTSAVTSHIYGTTDTTSELYNDGADFVGILFAVYNGFAALVAFLLGSITAYILNVRWVFNRRTFKNKYFEITIFIVIGDVGLILNQYIIWFFTENANFHYLYSKLVATMIVVIWNFFTRKYFLFR